MLHHVMLDLETWGTVPYSTIIMIGACEFDPYSEDPKQIITDRFEVAIEPVNAGLRVDVGTLMWWMDAKRELAREVWLRKSKVALHVALDGFSDWLTLGRDANDLRIWGNGAGFDNTLLRQAYEMNSREAPWSFRHDRCFRTLRNVITIPDVDDDSSSGTAHLAMMGVAHTALADAENQAIFANQIVRKMGVKLI